MIKKILAAFLTLLMAASAASCGQKAAPTAPPATSAPAATAAPATEAPATEAPATEAPATPAPTDTPAPAFEKDSAEFPGVIGLSTYDPPITLTYARNAGLDHTFAPGQSYENNIWMTEYKDILGININTVWTAEGPDAYDTKLNLAIASQDIPDVFVCNAAQFTSLLKAGMIEDLTDVLQKYETPLISDNLKADNGVALGHNTVNGKVYGLPQGSAGPGNFEFVFVREDWRTALGLPEPKTMDDIWNMAKAFTGNNLDNSGLQTYGLGLGNQPFETYWAIRGFCNAYGAYFDQWLKKDDGSIVNGTIQPEMKNALGELKKYIDAGYVNPEWVTTDAYTASQDAVAGKSGIAFGQWWIITWPLPDSYKLGHLWRAYPIPTSASSQPQRVGAVIAQGPRYVVKKGAAHPEALVKMYNLFQERVMSQKYDTTIYKNDGTYDFESLTPIYTVIGPERNSRNYTVVTKAVNAKDPSLLDPGNADQKNNYDRAIAWLNKTGIEDPKAEGYADKFAELYTNWYGFVGTQSVYGIIVDDYTKNNLMKVDVFTGAPTDGMVKYTEQLKSLTTEAITAILSGAEPLDYFDQFVSDWNSTGGSQITPEVNDWYAVYGK